MHVMFEQIGVQLPIVQAPMAGVQDAALVIAVCKAGGLGSLPCAMLTPEMVESEVNRIRAATSNPFNLNFFCHTLPEVTDSELSDWSALFAADYQKYGVDEHSINYGSVRRPFSAEFAEVVKRVKPAVVSFHFGLPSDELLAEVRESGALIFSSATTAAEAIWLEEQGVDAIIAQGVEAGGHRGIFLTDDLSSQLPTKQLLKDIVERVKVPVIAAGGVGSAQDVKDLIELGASAVQVGTSFLLCDEAKTSPLHREALAASTSPNTVITNIFSGRPARGIVNGMIEKLGAWNRQAPSFPYATPASAPLRSAAEELSCADYTPLWSGTNTAGCKAISAELLTRELVSKLC